MRFAEVLRREACVELGVTDFPTIVRPGLSEEERRLFARKANMLRRHLSRKQVQSVLDELETLIHRHIKKRSVGEFTLPGLLKIRQVRRPATKRRMGRNPATGEEIVIGPKPASTRVRDTALKKLKQMVL